jgi:hypothetical protein
MAVFEKVTVTQLVKKFYASHGTRQIIIMFITAHHLIVIYSWYYKAHSPSFLEDNQCRCQNGLVMKQHPCQIQQHVKRRNDDHEWLSKQGYGSR